MKTRTSRIKALAETLEEFLQQEERLCQEMLSSLLESVSVIQSTTSDVRIQRLGTRLHELRQRIGLLIEISRRDFLGEIKSRASELTDYSGKTIADLIASIVDGETRSLNSLSEILLDRLIELTSAERGFILFYLPESTEADVIAARNFQTKNLSLEEYRLSRSVLSQVLSGGVPLLLEDASNDPNFSDEASVIQLNLKSVLAAPLKHRQRTLGAIYLENNSRPGAFDAESLALLDTVAHLAVFYLHHARFLPVEFQSDSRIFFDASKASREIVGRDPVILRLLETIERLANSPATVLIEGESGTGKELVARALHYQGTRHDSPFVAINCAAIPDTLLESELFGHEKGAFTGATERRIGRIEQANGGTLFLDEVNELAYPLQAKLLRFLQCNEFDRVGGRETIRVDVRVVAATSKNLKELSDAGKFQAALFYRLNVIPLRLPSLRERKSDIPLLIDRFLEKFSLVYDRETTCDPEVYEYLKEYNFPGNVRELENLIHRLVALSDGGSIRLGNLPSEILGTDLHRLNLARNPLERILNRPLTDLNDLQHRRKEINRILAERERELTERAIEESGGNLTQAALRLGIHRITLHKMIKRTKNG